MDNQFFERPILNSPYEYPARYWELDEFGQPTQQIIETRRRAEFVTPIPKPRKRKTPTEQQQIVFDEGKGLSTEKQQYEATSAVITPWPGGLVCAEGRYVEGAASTEKRAAIFIGPEFGPSRSMRK